MALALNSKFHLSKERCLRFPPCIQDWVADLGNGGEVKGNSWAFFPLFRIGACNNHHHMSNCTFYHLPASCAQLRQNYVVPRYCIMIRPSCLPCLGGTGHVCTSACPSQSSNLLVQTAFGRTDGSASHKPQKFRLLKAWNTGTPNLREEIGNQVKVVLNKYPHASCCALGGE